MSFTLRETVRYKLYFNSIEEGWFRKHMESAKGMYMLANYSQPCYTDLLNKENKRRLEVLRDESVPYDTYIENVGCKVRYKYAKNTPEHDTVFIIDGVRKRTEQKEATGRVTMPIRRVRLDKITMSMWKAGQGYVKLTVDEAFVEHARYYYPNEVFIDRLTKKENDKLSMLLLMPPDVYLAGVGCVREQHTRYRQDGTRDIERLYYLEV